VNFYERSATPLATAMLSRIKINLAIKGHGRAVLRAIKIETDDAHCRNIVQLCIRSGTICENFCAHVANAYGGEAGEGGGVGEAELFDPVPVASARRWYNFRIACAH